MKKPILLFLLVVLSFFSHAQADLSVVNNFCIVLNGKEVRNSTAVSTADLKHLDSLQVKNLHSMEIMNASFFEWVISHSGAIYKGTIPPMMDKEDVRNNRLRDLIKEMKTGDIVFIEKLKLNEGKISLPQQFALKVE